MAETFDVEAVRARCNAATEGPWQACTAFEGQCPCHIVYSIPADGCVVRLQSEAEIDNEGGKGLPESDRHANRDFIAHARTDLPAALDEIERLRALVYIPSAQEREAVDRLIRVAKSAAVAVTEGAGMVITGADLLCAAEAVEAARAK